MNFLELAKKTAEKCGVSGTVLAVSGQPGELQRLVNWVNEAWHDIQLKSSEWDWMRYDFTLDTTAQECAPNDTDTPLFSKWHVDTFRIYTKSIGINDEQFLVHWDYRSFRDTYMYGQQTPGRPSVFAVRPRGSNLLFGPIPDVAYTVYGEYQKKPSYMVAATDTPAMPEEYHMAIVHAARMKYAAYENAPEVMAEANADYSRIMNSLSDLQMEEFHTGQPLA
jgi:hypothetical protein